MILDNFCQALELCNYLLLKLTAQMVQGKNITNGNTICMIIVEKSLYVYLLLLSGKVQYVPLLKYVLCRLTVVRWDDVN